MRCLDERPRQVLVTVLGIPFALLLTIAGVLAIDAARIRRKVARTGKATNWPGFQQDRRRQYPADAGDGRHEFVLCSRYRFLKTLFQQVNLMTLHYLTGLTFLP